MELLLCSLKQTVLPNLVYTRRMELLLAENSEEDEMGQSLQRLAQQWLKHSYLPRYTRK
uniref:Rho-GAP domain-containing protein n=1 Tax=Nelumbo nucifera TaxID=4432 RepID=A0A822ZAF6_NELNU|nr:TPA_asm: hypothetical protein HUJ06_016210 [Nelumbo nucifera]